MLRLLDLLPDRADRARLLARVGDWCLVGVVPNETSGWSYRTNASILVGGGRSITLGDAVWPLRKRKGDGPFATTVLIGRAASTDVVVEHPSVSKLHARFELRPGQKPRLSDAGSSNGTTLRGVALKEAAVDVDDSSEVVLGACSFVVCSVDAVAGLLDRLVRAGQ